MRWSSTGTTATRRIWSSHRAVVHFAVDQDQVYMTTRLAGKDTVFLPFNQGSHGPGAAGGAGNPVNPDGYRARVPVGAGVGAGCVAGAVGRVRARRGLLDDDGRKTGRHAPLFPRFHQWDAVERLLAATRARVRGEPAGAAFGRVGEVEQIAWLAHGLSRLHTPAIHGDLSPELTRRGWGRISRSSTRLW